MSIKTSTGLRNGMMVTGSFKSLMDTCTLKIYAGIVPATADAALSGNTMLVEIKNGGATLSFNPTAVDGVVEKTTAETWSAVIAAGGTAAFYRLELAADSGGLSTTEMRLQGLVATSGSDLNLTSIVLALGATQNIDFFSVSLPTL